MCGIYAFGKHGHMGAIDKFKIHFLINNSILVKIPTVIITLIVMGSVIVEKLDKKKNIATKANNENSILFNK